MNPVDWLDDETLRSQLELDEGRKKTAYLDTKGICTVGVGRNLMSNGLSDDEIDLLLTHDIQRVISDLDVHAWWWRQLSDDQARVLINLCFNMGWNGLSQFVKFLAAMERMDFPGAATELQNSLWYKQVGERGPRMIKRLTN